MNISILKLIIFDSNKLFIVQSNASKTSYKVRRSAGNVRKAYNKWVDYDNWKLLGNTIYDFIASLPTQKKVCQLCKKILLSHVIIATIFSQFKEFIFFQIGAGTQKWVFRGVILLLPKLRPRWTWYIRLF